MARFTSIHPHEFVTPRAVFVRKGQMFAEEGDRLIPDGDWFVFETDSHDVAEALRGLPASMGIVEHLDDLDDLTIAELRDVADQHGADLTGLTLKSEIQDAIIGHLEQEPEATPVVVDEHAEDDVTTD